MAKPTSKSEMNVSGHVQKTDMKVQQERIVLKKFGGEKTAENQRKAQDHLNPETLHDTYFYDIYEMKTETIPIKLIISSLSLNEPPNKFFNALGKLFRIAKLGSVHTAIQIGPCILDWNASAIVQHEASTDYANYQALAVVDVGVMNRQDFLDSKARLLAERIVSWNIKPYSQFSTNCQAFTTDMLKVLNLKLNDRTSTHVGHFIHNLQNLDHKDIPFKFSFQGKEIVFNNHKELDIFCHDNHQYLSDTCNAQAQQERKLLKAFDRVFWLRLYDAKASQDLTIDRRNEFIKKFESYPAIHIDDQERPGETHVKVGTGCYFHDPGDTDTMYQKTLNIPNASIEDAEDPGVAH
eukprot:TRINITY_DN1028_c0_g2_i1.p1 TRINITY_DN1028_c0_g2~~TRINITY_DN1028_c0_g2_i1.p1  ORF type:complete len:351 (-),score=97.35 TRINITY_DN1028_c0_g2_i1:32-1084(-)